MTRIAATQRHPAAGGRRIRLCYKHLSNNNGLAAMPAGTSRGSSTW